MIDPRALQQHFKKVNQRQEPKKPLAPIISEFNTLTALQVIPVIEPVLEEEQTEVAIPISEEAIETLPSIEEEPVTLENTNIEENIFDIKDDKQSLKTEDQNPYGYSSPKEEDDDYNPYGYYSGPRF